MKTTFKHFPTFVVHVRGNAERESHITKELKKHEIEFEFMLDGNLADINPDILDKYFIGDQLHQVAPFTSCTLKHLYIYERIVSLNITWALVLEDDIVLSEDFNDKIYQINEELKPFPIDDAIIVSLENCGLKFVSSKEIVAGKMLYQKEAGRCAGAYLINQKGAQSILEYINENKCSEIIDWQHNVIIKAGLLKMYWSHPTIAEQASHNGQMNSLLRPTRVGVLYRIGWAFRKKIRQIFS